jgi:hypothetical protein
VSDAERLTVGVVFTAILFLAPAFLFHTAPEFPGSLTGGILGIAAAVLMVLLLVYPLTKYVSWLRNGIGRVVPLRALLSFHVYAGVAGGFLAIVHTGHRYESPLGIALIVSVLIVVVTGFVGRYYMPKVTVEIQDHQKKLATLRTVYDRTAALATSAASTVNHADIQVLPLVHAMADLEYAIGSQRAIKVAFGRWIVAHVVAAIAMYVLLALHIMAEIYYGLRWLQ